MLLAVLPPNHFFAFRRFLLRLMGVSVAPGVRVVGGQRIYGRGVLLIGADSWIGPNCEFYTEIGAPISIGARCDIAMGVQFIAGTHDIGTTDRRAGAQRCSAIHVGDGSWIGTRATLMAGSQIGHGSVIGAHALVLGEISPDTLAVGISARAKRRLPAGPAHAPPLLSPEKPR
jgi:maltose O-acetyltransferase